MDFENERNTINALRIQIMSCLTHHEEELESKVGVVHGHLVIANSTSLKYYDISQFINDDNTFKEVRNFAETGGR